MRTAGPMPEMVMRRVKADAMLEARASSGSTMQHTGSQLFSRRITWSCLLPPLMSSSSLMVDCMTLASHIDQVRCEDRSVDHAW